MNNIGKADLAKLKEKYPNNYEELLTKIQNEHYPIQYLIGNVEFYNTIIKVNENVLIPRFETELLVEKSLKYLKENKYNKIIDLCTGSGCIAISLKKNLDISISACDISQKALKIAKENALLNNVSIDFFYLDILKDTPTEKYDCIISNPPYVALNEKTSPETKYEPSLALYAKDSGLEFYKQILKTAKSYLNKNGSIIFEIGATQAKKIKEIALTYYPKAIIKLEKDLNNFDRYVFIKI